MSAGTKPGLDVKNADDKTNSILVLERNTDNFCPTAAENTQVFLSSYHGVGPFPPGCGMQSVGQIES